MFRARVFARTLLYVVFVTSTFFRWLFSNYVEDYLNFVAKHLGISYEDPYCSQSGRGLECIGLRFLSRFWDVGVVDVEIFFGKLFGKDAFTKLTRDCDLLKLFHDETIVLVNCFSFTYGHTR